MWPWTLWGKNKYLLLIVYLYVTLLLTYSTLGLFVLLCAGTCGTLTLFDLHGQNIQKL